MCVRSVQPEDFTLVVLHIDEGGRDNALVLCGDEAFDTVLFSTSYTPRPYVDPAKLGAGTALEGCTDSSSTRFDTVSLHLSEEGARHLTPFTIPDGFERGRTMVFVQLNEQETPRCPSTGVDLVVETLVPDPDNPGQCDPRMPPCMLHLLASYSLRRAQGGTTTAFTVDDPRDGAPPFFVESSLRPRGTAPEGLLVEGDCPPDVCGAGSGPIPMWSRTRYFPPHGVMSSRFALDDEAGFSPGEREPRRLSMLIEYGSHLYFSPEELADAGADIVIEDALGRAFDPTAACPADRRGECLTVRVRHRSSPPGAAWPMGAHIRSLEVLSDDSLLFAGDPLRLELPPATQSRQGAAFERGDHDDGLGEVTTSLVQLGAGSYRVPLAAPMTIDGAVATDALGRPRASRIELHIGGVMLFSIPVSGPTFAVELQSAAPFEVVGQLSVHAFDASDRYLGYDLAQVVVEGAGGSGTLSDAQLGPGGDLDGDGLSNAEEYALGTSGILEDSDGDGIGDAEEAVLGAGMGADPTSPDTDGDGRLDGEETGDGNRDGIPDRLDPDDATIGLDPASDVYLVRERWTTDLQFRVQEEGTGRIYDGASTVAFTVTYALVLQSVDAGGAEVVENWLSSDRPTAVPLHDDEWDVLFRSVRLDDLGVPFLSEIEAQTPRCDAGVGMQACDLVPVQLIADMASSNWRETAALWLPRDDRPVEIEVPGVGGTRTRTVPNVHVDIGGGGDAATYRVEIYPREGVGLTPSGPFPVAGWGPLGEVFGGAAHYAGADTDGDLIRATDATRARHLLVSSLQPTVDQRHFVGPAFVLCTRDVDDPDPSARLPVGHPDRPAAGRCHPIDMGEYINGYPAALFEESDLPPIPTPWMFDGSTASREFPALDLGFFGGMKVQHIRIAPTLVRPASWAVRDETLISLLAGVEIADETTTIASGPDRGRVSREGQQAFLGQHVSGEPALRRLTRRIERTITNLRLRYVEGVPRTSYDEALSGSTGTVEGTDLLWNGRAGRRSRARGGSARDAERGASADWFRVHIALDQPTRPAARRVLRDVVEQCRRARSAGTTRLGEALPGSPADIARACTAHLRVQVETPARYLRPTRGVDRCRGPGEPADVPMLRGPVLECVRELRQSGSQREGVILSQDVPFDHLWRPNDRLDPAAHEGGILLRWTGQVEPLNTLNRLDESGGEQRLFANIIGCVNFPDVVEQQRLLRAGTPLWATEGNIVHPGEYVLSSYIAPPSFRGGPAEATSVSCAAGFASVDPVVRSVGRRARRPADRRIHVGLPVRVETPGNELALGLAATYPGFASEPRTMGVVESVNDGLASELTSFFRDLGVGVDVRYVGLESDVLLPEALLALQWTATSGTGACEAFVGRSDPGEVAGFADVTRTSLLVAPGGCVIQSAMSGPSHARELIAGLCQRTGFWDPSGPCPGGTCRYLDGFLPGAEALAPMEWSRADATIIGQTLSYVPLHEVGHILGLSHVAPQSRVFGFCESPSSSVDCSILDSGFCAARAGIPDSGLPSAGSRRRMCVGMDGFQHLLASPALPVTRTETEACAASAAHAELSGVFARPMPLYRANLRRLTADPVQRRALREALLREAAGGGTDAAMGGRALIELTTSCGSRDWVRRRVQSVAFLRAQYGPYPAGAAP